MSRSEPLFDVEDHSSSLTFQDFGNSTIQSDLPSGRISPAGTPGMQAQREYYQAEQRFGSTIDGATKSGGVLNLDFYSSWFDVDTLTVLTRCYKTLIPKEDYVNDVLSGVPDLYGPFWIPTTLVFSLFLTSSLISSVNAYLAGLEYTYDFTRLGAATSVVYTYYLGLPVLVWAAIKYWAGASDRSPVEIVSLYGYSSTIWILVAWLSLIPSTTARLFFVFVGTVLSLFFLVRNLYPILANAPNVSARLLVVIVGFLHLVLAVVLYWSFLEGGSGNLNADKGIGAGVPPTPSDGAGGVEGDTMRLFL
ncbi:Yip5p [Sporobolomyces koalae]|uniref:Yip5p n=1 Tax=Sporobolomyces koalae TaxID=500713 RepID=UPI00317FBF9D